LLGALRYIVGVFARWLRIYLLLGLRKIDVAIAEMSLDIIMTLTKISIQNGGLLLFAFSS